MQDKQEQDKEFDATRFIEEQRQLDTDWQARHFPDGSLRYEFRDEKYRVANCRKSYGVGINESGILYIKKGFPCHVVTGPNACKKCLSVRENRRRKNFSDRIENVADSVGLYFLITDGKVSHRRVVQNCKHHGYDFFSVPTIANGEKLVLVSGPVRGSEPISRDDARRAVSSWASVLLENRKMVVSGKLGKVSDDDRDRRDGDEIVEIHTRYIIYTGDREPSALEVAVANARVANRSRSKATDITAENVQEIVTEREGESMLALLSMGFRCRFSAPKCSKFNLASIKKQWLSIQSSSCVVSDGVAALDDTTRYVIGEAVRIHNKGLAAVDFDSAVESVLSSMEKK